MTDAFGLWFRRYRPRPEAEVRLVCFPHGGGGASFFRRWTLALPPSVEVLVVQYPGREDRRNEEPVGEMSRLADLVTAAFPSSLERPLVLFGHSMGAAIAYEVARRLEARGESLLRLVVSAYQGPRLVRHELKHLLDDDALWEDVRRLNGTHADVISSDDVKVFVLPALRSDYRLIETYRSSGGPPLRTPIAAFAGDADPDVRVEDVRGWAEETRGGFDLRVFPGDHFYLLEHQAGVLAALLELLGLPAAARAWPSTP